MKLEIGMGNLMAPYPLYETSSPEISSMLLIIMILESHLTLQRVDAAMLTQNQLVIMRIVWAWLQRCKVLHPF